MNSPCFYQKTDEGFCFFCKKCLFKWSRHNVAADERNIKPVMRFAVETYCKYNKKWPAVEYGFDLKIHHVLF